MTILFAGWRSVKKPFLVAVLLIFLIPVSSRSMDVFNPEKNLCFSSHIVVAIVVTARESGCYDSKRHWDNDLSKGVACDANHVGPQRIRIKQVLGAGSDDPRSATNQNVAVGDMVWVRPSVFNETKRPQNDPILEGREGALDVPHPVNRSLKSNELRQLFVGKQFVFAVWLLDPEKYQHDPEKLPINAQMYTINQLPWVAATIKSRHGEGCPAPVN
jgi:hypothetical protein